MKIALFLPNPGGGGAERVMVHLANALVKRSIKVSKDSMTVMNNHSVWSIPDP